ncbi:MAG: KilA-N domain-containing protein [Bacteroidaceae bacterium]|nr:KilA-N domain-containing protein [Bacteroidaceae bacterium]MDY4744907.1 KilA-N domain-containing protein [Bacteroidaceae bacterium]
MAKVKSDTLHVKGIDVGIYTEDYRNEYISLTDIARFRNSDDPRFAIQNWMRNRNTIEFLGLWESLHNPNFNRVQFDTFRTEAGLNRFVMTPSKWVENTGSIGITAKAGRYGGTYAHSDIAMEFASWISAEFKLYLMKDYRRLKFDENSRLSLSWNLNREISKLNYRVHTNAIQQNLLPPDLTREQQSFVYADEADMLNVALFGLTAAQWRSQNQGCKGNIRDYASLQQLLVLANMESYNALLIEQKLPQTERLQMLRQMAVRQLQVLSSLDVTNLPSLPPGIGND